MTTEGESDNVKKTVRTTRKRSYHVSSPLKSLDDENSDLSEEASSGDEWKYTKKKTPQRKLRNRPARTLKKSLAEKEKKLKSEFNETVRPISPDIRPPSEDTNSDTPKPDTTTLESCESSETEEKKPILTYVCDVTEKVPNTAKTNEVADSFVLSSSDSACGSTCDISMKCDSSIKTEHTDTNVVKVEKEIGNVKVESEKNVKPEKTLDADADTVILLSDDEDDVPDDPNTVVLTCNLLQTYASPMLTGSENRSESTSTVSPTMPTIRVRPLEQISNPPSSVFDVTVSPAISPGISYSSVPQGISDTPFPSPLGPHGLVTTPPAFPSPVLTPPRTRRTRGSPRGSRQSPRGQPPRAHASPDVRCMTPRSRKSTYNHSPRLDVSTSPRLDSISFSNISPTGTIIRNGLNSITVTPTKKSPERPAQRRLFRSEVEGIITARDTGYVVSLANGTHFPLSHIQVEKLRQQNNGVLPTKLRIPVPSDVAATIETRIVIED